MTFLTIFHILACIILILVVLPAVGQGGRLGFRVRRDHQPGGVRRPVSGDASHQGDRRVCRDLHGDLFGIGDPLHAGDGVTVMEDVPVTGEAPETPPAEAVPEGQQ